MRTGLNFGIILLLLVSLNLLSEKQVIVKKIFPVAEKPQKEYILVESEPEVKVIYVEQCSPELTYFPLIHPSDIPETKRWLYRGEDLKMHIFITHGIQYERMKLLGHNDLVKLHSYLHNGGSL
jgi:hypothetical protein